MSHHDDEREAGGRGHGGADQSRYAAASDRPEPAWLVGYPIALRPVAGFAPDGLRARPRPRAGTCTYVRGAHIVTPPIGPSPHAGRPHNPTVVPGIAPWQHSRSEPNRLRRLPV